MDTAYDTGSTPKLAREAASNALRPSVFSRLTPRDKGSSSSLSNSGYPDSSTKPEKARNNYRKPVEYDYNSMGQGEYGAKPRSRPHSGNRSAYGPASPSPRTQAPVPAVDPDAPLATQFAQLKIRSRQLREQCSLWEMRHQRLKESHRSELQRAQREADYQRRQAKAAEARIKELEAALAIQQRVVQCTDEAQNGLVNQSQLLWEKNSELNSKLQQTERELQRQKEAAAHLKEQVDSLQIERDKLMNESENNGAFSNYTSVSHSYVDDEDYTLSPYLGDEYDNSLYVDDLEQAKDAELRLMKSEEIATQDDNSKETEDKPEPPE